jgi:hypothetical protein
MLMCSISTTNIIAEAEWSPAKGLEYNMIIYGKILVDGNMIQSKNYVIGAFDDQNVCKGKAEIKMHNDKTNFYMTVLSNKNGEKLYIKIMNEVTGVEYKVFDALTFKSDSTIENMVLNA